VNERFRSLVYLDNSEKASLGVDSSTEVGVTESRWLILETSGRVGQVALAVEETLRAHRNLDAARRHARDLAPTVSELLSEQGWRPRDLSGVVVSRGPGSYTGLRVGIMSAKIVAYATGCDLIGVETFEAIASQAPGEAALLEVIGDAQQSKVYVQQFERIGGRECRARTTLTIEPLEEWLAKRDSSAWFVGPGLHRFREQLPGTCRVVDPEYWDPKPEALLRIARQRVARNERDDPWTLAPLYLRASSAEEQWARRR
jgi:tRNA threonylcarbamoyladenosine biosynthesis protein TsaB